MFRPIGTPSLEPYVAVRFWDFLVYIEKSAICEKNSDGRGRFKIRNVWAARGASMRSEAYVSGFDATICKIAFKRKKSHIGIQIGNSGRVSPDRPGPQG